MEHVSFKGDRQDPLASDAYRSRWHGKPSGWLASLTMEETDRMELGLPHIVCEYEDVFPEELPGLPPPREMDFTIELQPGTAPISMAPYQMAPAGLRELKTVAGALRQGFFPTKYLTMGSPCLVCQKERRNTPTLY